MATKLRAQIHQFLGILSPRFSKPQTKFLEQMLFGISASQDCKLSQVARGLGEPILLKKTEERRSRHLAAPGLGRTVQEQIVRASARRVKADTLIVVDPTDVRKPCAQAMPHLARGRVNRSEGGCSRCCRSCGRPKRRTCAARTRNCWKSVT